MKKALPIITSLLVGIATAFSAPNFTLVSKGDLTELTAVSSDGTSFKIEDEKRDLIADKFTEWSIDEQAPAVYTGEKITTSQQEFFKNTTKNYLRQKADEFTNAFKKNSKLLDFYTPFWTANNNGRAILHTNDIEYKVSESADGLSFSVRILSKKGEKGVDYLNIENILPSSPLYSGIKTLVDNLTTERNNLVQKEYDELTKFFSSSTSK